jgi:hypothetical protein
VSLQTETAATEPAALRQRIVDLDCRLLVLGGSADEGRPEELHTLVGSLACNVFVVPFDGG